MSVTFLAVDLETTGLDQGNDHILEVAYAPLDAQFQKLADTKSFVIEMTPAARERLMGNDYTREMHRSNGLIRESLDGGLPLAIVEKIILNAVSAQPWADGRLTVFGSSVHFDLRFLQVHMPELSKWLHYRVLDVTTLLSFADAAGVPREEDREVAHRAAADIDWSIETAQRILGALRLKQGALA